MSDSELLDALDEKHEENHKQRIEAIKHWVQFIEENPPTVWGPQQNALVDSQLRSARELDLGAEHYRRIERASQDG